MKTFFIIKNYKLKLLARGVGIDDAALCQPFKDTAQPK